MSFIEYLVNRGYKPYRKVYDRNKKEFVYIEDNNLHYFSSSVSGYTDIRLINGDREVIYGLHQSNHSPTLIYPRPNNITKDEEIDRLFIENSYDQICDMLKL